MPDAMAGMDARQEEAETRPAVPIARSSRRADRRGSYLNPTAVPVLEGPLGIRFDFNLGARVLLPRRETGTWRLRLRDLDTGNLLFATEIVGGLAVSAKRYVVRFGIEIDAVAADGSVSRVFTHACDLRNRSVLIQFPVGTLGDTLAWFAAAARFAALRGARVTCVLSGLIIPLLRDAYPELTLMTPEEATANGLAGHVYATYRLGLFFDDAEHVMQPCDFRLVGLHRTAAYILGIDPIETPPRLAVSADDTRPIEEPYVCIATQASSQCKYWNNPHGWREVVAFLRRAGYRVICIDQKPVHGTGLVWNHLPHGAEDETGDRPLAERARWLRHAAFFVGLSSGLSWLAWAAGTQVVLISGFTHPINEFHTPYRVINWHACTACWNDPAQRFDHNDFLWCPRHAGTPRQFECTRLITAEQVLGAIRRLLRTDGEPVQRINPVPTRHEGENR